MSTDRHSKAGEESLLSDPAKIEAAEAINSLRQFDAAIGLLEGWLTSDAQPQLRPSHILRLNRVLLSGISRSAGTFRTVGIEISKSSHRPPDPSELPGLLESMCDYVNDNWTSRTAVHLAAYVLWRLNWIHPFVDGNGRTARIVSYIVLCARLKYLLPGSNTIPEQIAAHKQPYYEALEAADDAIERGIIDVSATERLLSEKLAAQLVSAHDEATGGKHSEMLSSEKLNRYQEGSPEKIVIEAVYLELPKQDKIDENGGVGSRNAIERNPVLATGLFSLAAVLLAWLLSYWF